MTRSRPEILSPDVAGVARAAEILRAGGLVAVPTETVYGLAADATSDAAVAGIYAAKGRPDFNPLIVHVPDLAAAEAVAVLEYKARDLAAAFWPGPLTMVLPLRAEAGLSARVTAGLPTVAVRVPAHPVMQAVLRAAGRPLAAPSANPSGRISATRAAHVVEGLGDAIDAVVDAGPCAVGVESTIVAPGAAASGGVRILRDGGIAREAIAARVGALTSDVTPGRRGAGVEAPGQLERHYAPRVPLTLGGEAPAGAVRIGFGAVAGDLSLSETGDPDAAAARLFDVLHRADALATARGAAAIWAPELPEAGLGRAVNDRLRRAATRE